MKIQLLTNYTFNHHGKERTLLRGQVVEVSEIGKQNADRLLSCKGGEVVTVEAGILPTYEDIVNAIEADPELLTRLKEKYGERVEVDDEDAEQDDEPIVTPPMSAQDRQVLQSQPVTPDAPLSHTSSGQPIATPKPRGR